MNEKKLAALHSHFTSLGVKLPPQSDFISSMKDERNAKDFFDTFDAQGAFDIDYDTFKSNYGIGTTSTQPQTVVGNFMQSAQDLAATALQEKAKSDARNEQIAGDIKSEQVRQKPKDYYTENVPQIQEKFSAQGEPQNLQAVMSPNNPKLKELRPKTGDFDINTQPIFRDDAEDTYRKSLNFERPEDAMGGFFFDGREETDPLKVGMEKYAEAKKSVTPTTQLQQIVEQNRPQIDPNNPLQVSAARYQKAINRDKAAIADIEASLLAPNGESGIMDYILPKSELSELSTASSMFNVNTAAKNLQERLDKGQILSKTQSNALKVIQDKVRSGEVGIKDVSVAMQAIEADDDNALLPYIAPLDREFAKTAYNDIDKQRVSAAYKKLPNKLTPQERLGFWFGTTKYNQQRKDKDDPAYLPYTMLAYDDQNISQQIERLKTLFPDQKEGAMSLEPPKGLAAEFPNPAERTYAYYQILANRYTQLTKELQNESISIDKEDKANLLDERLKANSMLQGAAMFLPIVGVQDVTNPKVKEWYSVLNKINALAPMIRNAKVGEAENEAQDYTLNRFTNATAEAALDIYGAPYEKTDRARVAGEQSEVINDAEINAKTGMNPESIAILKERSRSGEIDDLATWGNAAGGFAGIMLPFVAAGMAGGNKMQGVTKGLSRLDKGSQIGKILLNAEGGLTKTGWLAQKAINLGMTGLQYEYAGAISGEGKELRNELRFSQGALGYAGSQALTGSLGLLMKGAAKIGGNFASKLPFLENGIAAIEKAYGSKYANYAKAYLANGFSELGEEIPQDWRNNLDEVKGDDTFQKMLAAAQKTANDIAYDDVEGKYSLSKTLGYALPIIAMGGKYDGIGVEDIHKIADWAVTFGEQITGEKTSEKDKQTINEFSDFIAEQAGQSPANVRFTDKGTLFTLDGKEYLYNAETQSVTSKQGVTEPEKQNAVNVAQEMMANYNKAIKEGDFTGLFGENVRLYNKQNEETAIPQQQEVPAQEVVQETPENPQGQVAQETPEGEAAEIVQETADIEAAEVAPTAEELDVRRAEIATRQGEIEPQLRAAKIEAEDLKKQLKADYSDEIADKLDEKRLEIDVLEKEGLDLADEDTNIASQRETTLTEKETIDKRKAEIKVKTEENSANIQQLQAQYESAVDEGNRDLMKSLSAEKAALVAENESLAKEIEALQPKAEVKKESPTIQENRIVETPIAETSRHTDFDTKAMKQDTLPFSKLRANVVERENNGQKVLRGQFLFKLKDTVDFLKEVSNGSIDFTELFNEYKKGEYEITPNNLTKAINELQKLGINSKADAVTYAENQVSSKKEPTEKPIAETPKKEVVEKVENLQNMTTSEESVTEKEKPKNKNIPIIDKRGEVVGMHTVLISDKRTFIEDEDFKKEKVSPIEFEETASQETETPVAPAAPKEEDNKPEKGKTAKEIAKEKTIKEGAPLPIKIKPKKEAKTAIVKSGKELAELLGNDEKAQATGKMWDRVAEIWAAKTGKTVAQWWDRIESITVDGEGKGRVEKLNDKFKVYLGTDRDVSTAPHELAHIFQNDLSNAEKATVVQWVNDKLGKKYKPSQWNWNDSAASIEISEAFAEGFIEYLKEKQKPNSKLKDTEIGRIFDKFADWLKGVVNTIFDAKLTLNPQMRALYESIFTEKEKAEMAEKSDYYIRDMSNAEFVKAESAKPIKLGIEGDFFIAKQDNKYKVFEAKTGLSMGFGWAKTQKEVIENANKSIEKAGEEGVNKLIEGAIKKTGISPRYLQSKKEDGGLNQASLDEMQLMIDWAKDRISWLNENSSVDEIEGAKEGLMELMQDSGLEAAEMQEIVDKAVEKVTKKEKAIPEQSFGRKVRDIYADRMSDVFQERMASETFAHSIQTNKVSFQMGLDRLNETMENAVATIAEKWSKDSKTPVTESTIEEWLKDDSFMAEVLIEATNSLTKAVKASNNVFNDTGEITELIVSGQMIIALIDENYANLLKSKKISRAETVFQAGLEMTKLLSAGGTRLGQAINLYKFLKPMSGKFVNRMLQSTIDEIMADISVDNRIKSELIGLVLDTDRQIMEEEAKSGETIDSVMDKIENDEATNKLLEEIAAHKAAWEKQHSEILELGKQLSDINKELTKTTSERDEAKDKLAQAETDLQEAKKQTTKDAAKIKKLGEKIIELRKEIRAKDKEIARLEGEKTTTEKKQTARGVSNATKRSNENKTLIKSILGLKPTGGAPLFQKAKLALGISVATDLQNLGYTFEDASKIITVINKLVTNNTISVYEAGNKTYSSKFSDDVIAATVKELNDMGADTNMVTAVEAALKNDGAREIMQSEVEKMARKDYQAAIRNRIVGILSNTNLKKAESELTDIEKEALKKAKLKVELRTILKDLVKKSVLDGNAEFSQVQSLLVDVLGIDVKNTPQNNDFIAILQKEWAKQTAVKREQLIKERLKTNAEKNEIADEKEKKEYLEKVQQVIDNPLPKLVQDMLTDTRLFTDGMQAVRDAFAEKYMLPAISETQMAEIRTQLGIVDAAPAGVIRDEAQMQLFRMYAKLFPISPIRKSHYLGESMFHANNLSGVPTHITNVTWSALELFTNVGSAIFQAFNANKRANLAAMAKVAFAPENTVRGSLSKRAQGFRDAQAKARKEYVPTNKFDEAFSEVSHFIEGLKGAFDNFFTSELMRNTIAQFSIGALRYQNEAIHVSNYMNRNYAEMQRLENREKRINENIKAAKQRLDDGKINQAQYDKLIADAALKKYGIFSDLANMVVNLFTAKFGQVLSNAYVGEIGNTGISGAALVSALLNGADVFFRTLHYAGTHAELLSRNNEMIKEEADRKLANKEITDKEYRDLLADRLIGNPSKQAFANKDSEAIKFEYKGKIESIGEILGKEVLNGEYEKDTPMYFQRRRELHQIAMEQLFGAAELAKDYSLRKMFKLRPSGAYGQLYDVLQRVNDFSSEAGLKQAENAYSYANEKQQAAISKAGKSAWWVAKQAIHAGYLVGKVIMAIPRTIAYVRVGLNIVERLASYEALYSVLNAGAVAAQTSFGAGTKYEKQRRFLKWNLQNSFEGANQKRRVSTIAHVNIGAEIADSQDAIDKLDSDIAKIDHSETEREKELNAERKAANEKAISLLDSQLAKKTITQAKYDTEKAVVEARINREFDAKIADVANQASNKRKAKENLKKAIQTKQNAQKAMYNKERNDLAWQITGNIIRFGLLIAAFTAHGDDDDDKEKMLDLSVVGGKKDFKGIRTPSSIRLEVMGKKMSFPATSTPFALDLEYFGGLFALERAERNTTKQKTTSMDKAAQAFPAIINAMWSVAAMRGMQDMINAFSGNDKSSSYLTLEQQYERQWVQYIRVLGNMQAVKVPAIVRGITKDIAYAGENIEIDKNAPFGEQIALNFARGLGLMDIGLGRSGTLFKDVVAPQVSDLDGKPIYLWQGGDKFNPYHYFSDMIEGKDTDRDPYAISGSKSDLLDFYDWIDKNGIQDVIPPVTGASYKVPQFNDKGELTGRMMNLPTVPLSAIRSEIGAKAFQKLSEMHDSGNYVIEISDDKSIAGAVDELVESVLKGDLDTEANKYSIIFANDKKGAEKFVVQEAAKDLYANENKEMQGVWSEWLNSTFGEGVQTGEAKLPNSYELQKQFKAR